ncbi:MAG: aspartate carbamoyltransferase catalytic subunit [Desulfovibrionaceae bacterium]|nr:aspartate carbamoyltransferase catalytic subunit [Desulfovibrionaceae bacterium]
MTSIHWKHKHLFDVSSLSIGDIDTIITLAKYFFVNNRAGHKGYSLLQGKNIILFFSENSTRTRLSFEIAAQRLGATTHFLQSAGSSMEKGETLSDTMRTLMAMRPDACVIRSQYSGAAQYCSSFADVPIINAGDGWHAHPTQALLDLFILHQAWKGEYKGKTITIVGDVKHSRVARSNIHLLQKLGIHVRICAPRTLSFVQGTFHGVEVYTDILKSVEGVDAIMALRLQRERQAGGLIPKEYPSCYCITRDVLECANPHVLLLHPGPVNPNIDIASNILGNAVESRIEEQVEAGVAVRMALLYLFCVPHAKVLY